MSKFILNVTVGMAMRSHIGLLSCINVLML